ncbi:adhesion G-protein coupled receptor D1-like [Pocillopora verrucosa]|uniref:adhesion G-protein coupled receptor D1-like n=1 Tax=Pocillopora verrucosa TaxID=203993 RepID=UPI0033429A09
MLLNLCVAIAASCFLIILVGYAKKIEMLCTVTAVSLHYFLLCVFSWMLGHGVILYFLIIKVETQDNIKSRMKWIYAFGWISPLPIVAVSLVLTGADSYAANNCWLTIEYGIIYWTFVVPVAIIVLINSILFFVLLHRISRASRSKEKITRAKHVRAWLRRSAMLLPLMGVTWLFGFLTFISSTVVFHYIFTILNSLQGFFIFFNVCVLEDTFRESMVITLCKHTKENSDRYLNKHALRSTPTQIQIAVSKDKKINVSQQEGFDDFANNKDSKRLKIKRQNWMITSRL